jgi:hypothetical protein
LPHCGPCAPEDRVYIAAALVLYSTTPEDDVYTADVLVLYSTVPEDVVYIAAVQVLYSTAKICLYLVTKCTTK